jgi:hypothetical protein
VGGRVAPLSIILGESSRIAIGSFRPPAGRSVRISVFAPAFRVAACFNDIVKRRFVLGPARGLSHGLADLNRLRQGKSRRSWSFLCRLPFDAAKRRMGIDNESD